MKNSDKLYEGLMTEEVSNLSEKYGKIVRKKFGIIKRIDPRYFNSRTNRDSVCLRANEISGRIKNFHGYTDKNSVVNFMDNIVCKQDSKISDIQREISRLKSMRCTVTGDAEKRRIDRNIEYQQDMIRKINSRKAIISKGQRIFVLPRYKADMHRIKMLSGAESKMNLYNSKMNYYESMKARLNPNNSIKDKFLNRIYDVRGRYYKSRYEYKREVLDEMQMSNSSIRTAGAGAIVLSKRTANALKAGIKQVRQALHI